MRRDEAVDKSIAMSNKLVSAGVLAVIALFMLPVIIGVCRGLLEYSTRTGRHALLLPDNMTWKERAIAVMFGLCRTFAGVIALTSVPVSLYLAWSSLMSWGVCVICIVSVLLIWHWAVEYPEWLRRRLWMVCRMEAGTERAFRAHERLGRHWASAKSFKEWIRSQPSG